MSKFGEKLLVLTAYLFFVPSLYIILTDRRHDPYCSLHAAQAFLLWIIFLLLYVLIPDMRYNLIILISLWVSITIMGFYTTTKEKARIPLISNLAEKL